MTSARGGAKLTTPAAPLAPPALRKSPLNWSAGLCSHIGKCSFPENTWWRFPLKSLTQMEASWRHAERSACY